MIRLSPRRADWLITGLLAVARCSGCWPSRAARGSGATRRSTCAPASATGAGSASLATTSGTATRRIVHRRRHRSLLRRQPRAPRPHEEPLRALLAGLSPLPLPGRPRAAPHRHAGAHLTLPLFAREATAFRFPAILMAACWRRWSTSSRGGSGARRRRRRRLLTIAQPHYFFHAQIACFDAPITTMAVAVGFAYWKSLR